LRAQVQPNFDFSQNFGNFKKFRILKKTGIRQKQAFSDNPVKALGGFHGLWQTGS